MTTVKFNDEDYKSIAIIIDKYKELEFQLHRVQTDLENLSKEKDNLLNTLESIRTEELSFFDTIEKIYGKGKLDLMTMEYIIENDK